MTKEEVRARIEEIGIIPAIRLASTEDARFAAESVYRAGLTIAEITLTTPGALELISALRRDFPDMVVGAGTVLDADTARRAVESWVTAESLSSTTPSIWRRWRVTRWNFARPNRAASARRAESARFAAPK